MVERPFVSIVMPVFSGKEYLTSCLTALTKQTYPQDLYEVVIVDNEPKSNLQSLLSGMPGVKLLSEDFPSSYAARNRGIQGSKGQVIAFTDVDCIPFPDWLTKGVQALYAEPGLGYVG